VVHGAAIATVLLDLQARTTLKKANTCKLEGRGDHVIENNADKRWFLSKNG